MLNDDVDDYITHGGRELSFCYGGESWILTVERCSWVFRISILIEILNITRCAARWDRINIVRIVSLSSCHHEPKSEIDKEFACICICVCIYII